MLKITVNILQNIIIVGTGCLLLYYILLGGGGTLSGNIPTQSLILISSITTIILITIRYRRDLKVLAKSLHLNDNVQSMALLDMLDRMVDKLDYRDNVLIQEKESAVAANTAKSDFLVRMSHELRTPMHAILNFADVGKASASKNDVQKIERCFARIEESGERLLLMINGLLDLTRLESGKVEFKFSENNMLSCINYVRNELAATLEKKSIDIVVSQRNHLNILKFDKEQITRVLINTPFQV